MVSCRLFARLANQCYMIACAIAHAKKMGTNYAVPRTTTSPRIWRTYFDHLPIARSATKHFYKEPRHCYDPLPLVDDLTIEGYFQSEKYFIDAKKEVSEALGFEVKPHGNIAVHIRRGDYLLYPTQFPVLPMEYYIEAIGLMASRGYNHFKIYSDDIPWCKQNFNRPEFNGLIITYSTVKDPLQDMKDMYSAQGFIVANSTYSLFAATLRSDGPIVIAPKESRWYGPAVKMETCDLMPERFIKI
jgi:hypothetical protein